MGAIDTWELGSFQLALEPESTSDLGSKLNQDALDFPGIWATRATRAGGQHPVKLPGHCQSCNSWRRTVFPGWYRIYFSFMFISSFASFLFLGCEKHYPSLSPLVLRLPSQQVSAPCHHGKFALFQEVIFSKWQKRSLVPCDNRWENFSFLSKTTGL